MTEIPASAAPQTYPPREVWAYVIGYYRLEWPAVLLYATIAAAQSAVFLPTLWLVRMAFDVAIPSANTTLLVWIGAGLLALRLADSITALGVRIAVIRTIKRATFRLRRDLLATLYGLSQQFFVRSEADRLHARIVQETERVDSMANAILTAMLPALLAGLVLGGVLLWLNWWLTLLAGCAVPVVLAASRMTSRHVKRQVFAFQRAFENFSRGVRFVLRQMDLTRARGFDREELARQTATLEDLRRTGERMATSYAVHAQVHQNVTGMVGLLLLVFGGIAIADKTMTLGDFVVFYLAAGLLNGFVQRVSNAIPDLITGYGALSTLLAIHRAGPVAPYAGTRHIAFRGRLLLRGVGYSVARRHILRDVTLDIRPGCRIAIIGPNGIGKSTILNLILGFCAPDVGTITAEGVDYREIDMRALRRSIGVVMQHPSFFTGSIAENIAYGAPQADQAAIEAAAKRAGADAFIRALPHGYATAIGDEGARFSGGELQRIAIARALVGNPALLLLDEPTNHLDTAAVSALMRELVADPAGPALLIVSHDPGVVAFATAVYRIEHGALVADKAPLKTPA